MPAEDRPPPRGTPITPTTPKEKGRRRVIPSTSSSPFPPPRSPSSCIRCRHRARLFLQPGIAAALPPPGAAAWLEGPGGPGGSGGRCRARPGSPALYGRAVHAAAGPGPGGERCPPPPAHSPGPPAAQVRSPRRRGRATANAGKRDREIVSICGYCIFSPGWGSA